MRTSFVYGLSVVVGGTIGIALFSLISLSIPGCTAALCHSLDATVIDGVAHIARRLMGNTDSVVGMLFWAGVGIPFVTGGVVAVAIVVLRRRVTD